MASKCKNIVLQIIFFACFFRMPIMGVRVQEESNDDVDLEEVTSDLVSQTQSKSVSRVEGAGGADGADDNLGAQRAHGTTRNVSCSTEMDMDRRVVLFGGTFDPPTKAHAALSKMVIENLAVEDCVWFAPSFHPVYKPRKSDFDLRMEMLQVVLLSGDLGPASKVSVTSAYKESYNVSQPVADSDVDALKFLQERYPKTVFDAQFGADAFSGILSWGESLLKRYVQGGGHVIVVGRHGTTSAQLDIAKEPLIDRIEGITFVDVPALPAGLTQLSSSKIRRAICSTAGNFSKEALLNAGLIDSAAGYLETSSGEELMAAYQERCEA